ncbi:gluconate 2-dehydrogenase subunit 3 family protein [Agaribacter flavus]|uniref:Gluconate 2-dehydrogenase subunit 3 family protein n=1 Tax=Agaribacter flavus TaxID=1902781 RepID=A0ABV7FRA7_9ALTE
MPETINRRLFIKGSLVSVTALCISGFTSATNQLFVIQENGQFFSATQLTMLSDIAEIMIPRTETPGAQDAQVAAVLDAMMITWASKKTQSEFTAFLSSINDMSRSTHDSDYLALSHPNRYALIEALDRNAFANPPSPIFNHYKKLKSLVFRLYYTSEEGTENHVPVPGEYHGDLTHGQYTTMMQGRAYGRFN